MKAETVGEDRKMKEITRYITIAASTAKMGKTLAEYNDHNYNLHKAAEELQELALVLTQLALKPKKVDPQEVIDEIGDVKIRLAVLDNLFDKAKVMDRLEFKLNKFEGYIKDGKFKGGI